SGRALRPRGPSSRCAGCARAAGVKSGSRRMQARSAQPVLARPTLPGQGEPEASRRDQRHPDAKSDAKPDAKPDAKLEPLLPPPPAADALFSARSIWLTRAGRAILQSVDIDIAEGEILTLIGPNGAGKTTLVRVLLGLETPDRGTIRRKPGLVVGY